MTLSICIDRLLWSLRLGIFQNTDLNSMFVERVLSVLCQKCCLSSLSGVVRSWQLSEPSRPVGAKASYLHGFKGLHLSQHWSEQHVCQTCFVSALSKMLPVQTCQSLICWLDCSFSLQWLASGLSDAFGSWQILEPSRPVGAKASYLHGFKRLEAC